MLRKDPDRICGRGLLYPPQYGRTSPYRHFIPPFIQALTCSFHFGKPSFTKSFSFVPSGSMPLLGVAPSIPHSTRGSSKRCSSSCLATMVLFLNCACSAVFRASQVCCASI